LRRSPRLTFFTLPPSPPTLDTLDTVPLLPPMPASDDEASDSPHDRLEEEGISNDDDHEGAISDDDEHDGDGSIINIRDRLETAMTARSGPFGTIEDICKLVGDILAEVKKQSESTSPLIPPSIASLLTALSKRCIQKKAPEKKVAANVLLNLFDAFKDFNEEGEIFTKIEKSRGYSVIRAFIKKMSIATLEAQAPVVKKKGGRRPAYNYDWKNFGTEFIPPMTSRTCPLCRHNSLRMSMTEKALAKKQADVDKVDSAAAARFLKESKNLAGSIISKPPKTSPSVKVEIQCCCVGMGCLGKPDTNFSCIDCVEAFKAGVPFAVGGNPRTCSCVVCACRDCRFTGFVSSPVSLNLTTNILSDPSFTTSSFSLALDLQHRLHRSGHGQPGCREDEGFRKQPHRSPRHVGCGHAC
jgi:hypothetical protein